MTSKRRRDLALILGALVAVFPAGLQAADWTLVGWSDLGLRETDGRDVSVYSLLPPYHTFHAQLIGHGKLVTNSTGITVTYEAVADSTGSIDSTSQGKGNFAQHAQALYGASLGPDEGLAGFAMPGPANRPQTMAFDPVERWFTAEGVPLTPYDDAGRKNYYPLMKLVARDSAGNVLASTQIALPVSDEMDCRACHASGSEATARPDAGWAWAIDPDRDYKLNILRNHDDHRLGSPAYSNALSEVGYNAAGLVATVIRDARPISCIRCHASNALPGSGASGMRPMTQLMHTKHAYSSDPTSGTPLNSLSDSAACLLCHAGPETRRVRGVHHHSVNPDGSLAMQCQSCHGNLSDVGKPGRAGWLDEPKCQSCHTGTATHNAGSLRYTSAFDASGQIRVAPDETFATQTNKPSPGLALYRASQGHGGLKCEACHGSPHAEWPTAMANDNVQSQQLQGTAGVLTDCSVCHAVVPRASDGGPHGLHPVDQQWAKDHEVGNSSQCRACHGLNDRGTALAWSLGDRTFSVFGTRHFWPGFQIGCYNCHNGPQGGENATSNTPASARTLSATTGAERPVTVALQASDPNGNALTFRIVTQPAHGTASLSGSTATYYPAPGFVGKDAFTFSAWDGSTDSNLGTVNVTITPEEGVLTARAAVPVAAYPNTAVPFRALASLSPGVGTIACDWAFGDGSPHASETNASHIYPGTGDYAWTLVVTANGASQTVKGVVTISPTLGPVLPLKMVAVDPYTMFLSWPSDSIPTSLETSFDPGQPYSWAPYWEAPWPDSTNLTQLVDVVGDRQFFRLRRVP